VSWLVVILGLALLILLHELGHFTVARLVGMKPRAFYIGFPPAVVKTVRNGVEYGIGAIPLGGYVRIPGMHRPAGSDFQTGMSAAVDEDPSLRPAVNAVQRDLDADAFDAADAGLGPVNDELERARLSKGARRSAEQAVTLVDEGCAPDAYWRQRTWKRVAVIAAGPLTNVLVAFVLFFAVYATGAPSSMPSTEVAQVQAHTPAAAAGLREGDHIVAVNHRRTRTFDHVSTAIGDSRGRPITVTVRRGSRTVTLGPRRTIKRNGRWVWGFVPATTLVSHPIGASGRLAARDCWLVVTGTVASVRGLFHSGGGGQISGPVGVVRTSEQFLRVGIQWYLQLLGLISMSLALFNLLPFLPLDGGHILVSLIEGVRGRALPQRLYERMSTLGITLIMFVTVIAFANDLGVAPH
jgi:regulator of sigma E protease